MMATVPAEAPALKAMIAQAEIDALDEEADDRDMQPLRAGYAASAAA